MAQFGRLIPVDIEEMARGGSRSFPSDIAWDGATLGDAAVIRLDVAGHSRATLSNAEGFADLALADDQRRQNAQNIVAGRQAQETLAAQFRHNIAGRHIAADAE